MVFKKQFLIISFRDILEIRKRNINQETREVNILNRNRIKVKLRFLFFYTAPMRNIFHLNLFLRTYIHLPPDLGGGGAIG